MRSGMDAPLRTAGEVVGDGEIGTSLPDTTGNMAMLVKGEIDAQIATARAFPRDIKTFLNELETMACSSQAVAASCFYKLKRKEAGGGTKFIEGPSVRFAELAVMAYGNARVQGRTTHDDGSYVYATGTALDLQKNVGIQIEVRRRITNKEGRRFSDDMVAVTANAAISLATRNAIFRVVPRALWEGIFEKTKLTAIGSQKSFLERRQGMVEYFVNKVGVTVEQLCKYLEIANLEAMTFDDLENAIGLATGLKDGDIKIDEAFPKEAADKAADAATGEPAKSALQNLTQTLQQEQTAKATTPATPAEPVTSEPAATENPPLSAAESNALDLELAAQDGSTTTADATPAELASGVAEKVKKLAGSKGMK